SAVLHRSEVVGRQVVAQPIALVHAGVQGARGWFQRDSYGVAQTGAPEPRILSVRIANGDRRATRVALDIDVGFRADAHKKMFAVLAEHQRARGVPAAREVHQFFAIAEVLRQLVVVLEAQYGVRIAHIDPIFVEGDAKRLIQALGPGDAFLRASGI